jgi:hypothetical protein
MRRSQLTRDSLRRSDGSGSSSGTITSIVAGAGISVAGGTGPAATVTNTGITSILAGAGISVTGGTGPAATVTSTATDLGKIAIVANVAALIALDVTTAAVYPTGTVAYVVTLKDFFVLNRSSAVANDTTNYLYVTATVGRWVRQLIPNPDWLQTTTWEISPATGSNEATGAAGFPLKSWSELSRRVRGLCFNASTVTISILDSLASTDPAIVNFDASLSTTPGTTSTIAVTGTMTTVTTGVLTGVVNLDETTNQPNEVTSAAGFGAYVNKYIRFLNGSTFRCSAWVAKDLGSGSARLSVACSENAGNSASQTNPVSGDNYEIYTLPTVPSVFVDACTDRVSFVKFAHLDVARGSSAVDAYTHTRFMRLAGCSFSGAANIRGEGIGLGLLNCLVGGGASMVCTGGNQSASCALIFGLYTPLATATSTQHSLGGNVFLSNPMFHGTSVFCDDVVQSSSGNSIAIFDTPASVVRSLYLHAGCNITLNILWGSGNAPTATLVQLGTNCVLSVFITLTLTGSTAYGVTMGNEPVQRVMSDMLYADFRDIFGAIMRGPGGGSPSLFSGFAASNGPGMMDCGEDLVPFRVCRADAALGMLKAKADTAAHATAVYGVSYSQNTVGGRVVFVNSGFVTVNFDVAPVVGDIAYLSQTNAGNATKTVPPVAATNQKLRLGIVVRVIGGGTLAVVHFRPELIPVTSDGVAP